MDLAKLAAPPLVPVVTNSRNEEIVPVNRVEDLPVFGARRRVIEHMVIAQWLHVRRAWPEWLLGSVVVALQEAHARGGWLQRIYLRGRLQDLGRQEAHFQLFTVDAATGMMLNVAVTDLVFGDDAEEANGEADEEE